MAKESFPGGGQFYHGSRNGGRLVDNAPTAPQVQTHALRDLAVFVPSSRRNGQHGLVKSEPAIAENTQTITHGALVVPVAKKAMTPIFTTQGGRKTGGGGTSKEAIQRAKRKLKRAKFSKRR